ncbi:MAG: hypothetical protein HZA51_14605 [Planctomycetes bacterium]|nr:hypothetical protein [Planctomycetota bacterium]
MHKKLMLVACTAAIGIVSYLVFSAGDRTARKAERTAAPAGVRQFVSSTTQPTPLYDDSSLVFSPGDQTKVRVYDEVSGRLKYTFEAKEWTPVKNVPEFQLSEVLVQIFTPRGEITYISADEARIAIMRKGKNRVEPKSGWMKKNVKVVIDRTTSAWREENPALAERDAHPDDLVHIDLEEAHFDLELAELVSNGPIRLDSADAKMENVRGLTVQWNQVDGRIDTLRFQQGGLLVLRRGGRMIDFAMPGTERDGKSRNAKSPDAPNNASAAVDAAAMQQFVKNVPKAQANQPLAIDRVTADQAADEIRTEGGIVAANKPMSIEDESAISSPTSAPTDVRNPTALAGAMESLRKEARGATKGEWADLVAQEQADKKTRRRIHTYRAIFSNSVVIEQKDGLKTLGKLEADKLELNFDFGKKQKELAVGGDNKAKPGATTKPAQKSAQPVDSLEPEDATRITLTWNGPLELHPLRVDASEQTGQRFDAVATGNTVRIQSEQGSGTCKQLVYRHERRQVWLSGNMTEPVQLAVDESRKLIGKEIFFDQKRGLAHIEGAGTMTDDRRSAGDEGLLAVGPTKAGNKKNVPAEADIKDKKPRGPVEITWSRNVDIEIGTRPVERINPSTGMREERNKEYLRRAWFHGEVVMKQENERLSGDEVAITFGAPAAGDQVADHIQHLDMTGGVRLEREQDVIIAQRLSAEMTVTPDKKNIPKKVDAQGDVVAKQGSRVIKADRMIVGMGLVPGRAKTVVRGDMLVQESKSRAGISTLDARGRVFVHDPEAGLKIRDAGKLQGVFKNGNELVRASIESDRPDTFARVRAGDTAIHGRIIEIDMPTESIDVPGPGRAYMLTAQDFGGRKLTKPSRVKITWANEMQMRGQKNYGVFVGDVHSDSDAFSLACEKLTVRLANAPATPPKPATQQNWMDHFWLSRLARAKAPKETNKVEVTASTPRKRPTYIVAEGKAEALSSSYARTAEGTRGRLLSRMQIAGTQIVADLARESMSVPGKGTLLIEDYQFESDRRKPGVAPRTGPLMSSAQGEGPSQSMVRWLGSMDYYVDQDMIAFDKEVEMVHRSGQEMVLREDLARGMGLDKTTLKNIRAGRRADLTCGYLLLEFRRGSAKTDERRDTQTPVRSTDLERLIAKHSVLLNESTKSLMGEYVQYLASSDEVQVEGSKTAEARITDQDEREQRMNMWRGPILVWNRKTNRIEAPQATIRTSRR